MLAVTIDLFSGDDGDSMGAPSGHHPINQTPRPCAELKLKDLIQVVVTSHPVAIHSSCHYHSMVDVRSSQTITRSWELSRIDPLGRVLHQQLRGGEKETRGEESVATGDEERLGPLLILKVAAPMIISALL